MGGRRKRPKSARTDQSCVGGTSSSAGCDSGDEYRFPVDSSVFSGGAFASRCSVRVLNEVVSKFDSVKRDLVKSTGFEALLYFPVFKQFNRKFSLWLMSCVNEKSCTINVGEHISLRFNKADVSHVIGIPACGKTILDARFSSREAKEKVLNCFLPPDFKELRSVKLVQEVLERQYEYPMSKSESDSFKVAFVVFVASNLLAPSAKYDYACVDYWNGIQDPESIGSYDWSEFVIVRLLEGVMKLKQDISSNIKFPNITGCSVFLQVLYLDSLWLEGLSKSHSTLPRIIDFPHQQIRLMIQADSNYAAHEKNQSGLPRGNVREASRCIYSWAYDHLFPNDVSNDGCIFAIWEASVALVNLLKIPLEAAGPIFFAVADFQEQLNSGLVLNGVQSIKIMSVIASIMLPYSRGFSYQSSHVSEPINHGTYPVQSAVKNGTRRLSFPIRIRKRRSPKTNGSRNNSAKNVQYGNIYVGSSITSGASAVYQDKINSGDAGTVESGQSRVEHVIGSLDGIPHKLNINLRVAIAMSQFYAAIRTIKPARDFDLNASSSEEIGSSLVATHIAREVHGDLASPWDLGYGWCIDQCELASVFAMLNTIECDDSFVIVHSSPRYIQVSLRALCVQILGKCEFELDLMDALMRNVIQEDAELYRDFGGARWRIFFESDFMESILTGSLDLVDANLGRYLRLNSSCLEMEKTKLVFFPLLLQCSWVCFSWNLDANELYVFEPSFVHPVPDFRAEVIERAAYLLKLALQTLSSYAFKGVEFDATCAELRFITLPDKLINRANRSGVLCSLFCRCFDGEGINAQIRGENVDAVAAQLLKQLLTLKNNNGSVPIKMIGEL